MHAEVLSDRRSLPTTGLSLQRSDAFIREITPILDRPDCPIHRIKIGQSERGKPIFCYRFGTGETHILLMAGAHSDEPVGPQTIRQLLRSVGTRPKAFAELLARYRFTVLPHINPDGESINRRWFEKWPDLKSYLSHRFREKPGRDLEFGYPDMRVENRTISNFLQTKGPFHLYVNLHGMGFAEGLLLLIEKSWVERTEPLRSRFLDLAAQHDLPLHDHDRKGEKGFRYLGPGFTTTPRGEAMKQHFLERDQPDMAEKFHLSSMEWLQKVNGDPLCLVTELPLYLVKRDVEQHEPGVPATYLAFKEKLDEIQSRDESGGHYDDLTDQFDLEPLPLDLSVHLQLEIIRAGITQIETT